MTAPDRMPEAFENSLHDAGHPHMEPPANPGRFTALRRAMPPLARTNLHNYPIYCVAPKHGAAESRELVDRLLSQVEALKSEVRELTEAQHPECLGCLEIEHQPQLGGSLNRQIAGTAPNAPKRLRIALRYPAGNVAHIFSTILRCELKPPSRLTVCPAGRAAQPRRLQSYTCAFVSLETDRSATSAVNNKSFFHGPSRESGPCCAAGPHASSGS